MLRLATCREGSPTEPRSSTTFGSGPVLTGQRRPTSGDRRASAPRINSRSITGRAIPTYICRIDGDPSPCNSETTLCGVTGYDPYNHWFTPFWGAWMSEVDNSGDDFAGVSDTPEKLTVVQERFGSSWTSEAFRTSDGHPADGWNWRWKGDLGSVGSRSVCWADQQDQNNTSAWNSWTQPTDHSC